MPSTAHSPKARFTPAQQQLVEDLSEGAVIERETSHPHHWYHLHPQGYVSLIRTATVNALIAVGRAHMEPISKPRRTHRLVATSEPAI